MRPREGRAGWERVCVGTDRAGVDRVQGVGFVVDWLGLMSLNLQFSL